jgi:tetratricopeptide (TPR) repeat protein
LKQEDVYLRQGMERELRGDLEGALAAYRAHVAAVPDDPLGHNKVGAILARLGHRQEARVALERALLLDSGCVPALANLGGIAIEEGQLDEAERYLEAALRLDPSYAPAYANLGVLRKRRGDIGGMVQALKQAAREERRRHLARGSEEGTKTERRLGCGSAAAVAFLAFGLTLWRWH